MGALKRIQPLLPAPSPSRPRRRVRAAKPHRYRLISFFQVDGPSSSLAMPLWSGARRGPRVPMPRGVCHGLRLPCGAALAHWPLLDSSRMGAHTAMCAGRVLVLVPIKLLLLLFASATEGGEMFMRLGGCVPFRLPKVPKSDCPDTRIRLPRHKWPKSWSGVESEPGVCHRLWSIMRQLEQVCSLTKCQVNPFGPNISISGWTKFVRTPACWPLVGKTIWGSSSETQMGKIPNWESKKLSPTQIYRCHLAPHRCGARGSTRWMGWRIRISQASGLFWKMESTSAWCIFHSSRHSGPPWNFVCLLLKARYPHLPNIRATTHERGNGFQGWATYADESTRLADGETLAGWSAVARSHHGRIDVLFGRVITTEAHLAFTGARTQYNNTDEMSAIIEALFFLGPHGPVARDANSCFFFVTPNMHSRHAVCKTSDLSSIVMKNCPFGIFFKKPASLQSFDNFCFSRSSANFLK